jgi:hypothetical protein
MKLKLTKDGFAEVKDGMPVYVNDDGTEIGFDAPGAMAKIASLNTEGMTRRKENERLTAALLPFKDITDPVAATKALQFAASMDGKKAMDDESIKKLIETSVKPFQDQLTEKDTKIKEQGQHIYKLEVSNRFASSDFLKKTIYGETPDMAEAYFGKNFRVEGGKVIAYDAAGNPIYSRIQATLGEPAPFEEAIQILVETHPKKDFILKASGASGSGAGGGKVNGSVKTLADLKTDVEKQKFITDNGLDAFKALPAA